MAGAHLQHATGILLRQLAAPQRGDLQALDEVVECGWRDREAWIPVVAAEPAASRNAQWQRRRGSC